VVQLPAVATDLCTPTASRPAVRPIRPPIECVLGGVSSSRGNAAGRWNWLSPPSCAEVLPLHHMPWWRVHYEDVWVIELKLHIFLGMCCWALPCSLSVFYSSYSSIFLFPLRLLSSSCLRILPCPPVPSISSSLTCFRRQAIPVFSSQPVGMLLVSGNLSGSSEVQDHVCRWFTQRVSIYSSVSITTVFLIYYSELSRTIRQSFLLLVVVVSNTLALHDYCSPVTSLVYYY
jgi:hypothetical protein